MTTFDLAAYLARIGLREPPPADRAGLAALQAAHLDAIGFDDLEAALGRIPGVALERVQEKLVAQGRGGWCFEHVVLFGAALDAVGFTAHRHVALMSPERGNDRPRTHALLRVALPEGDVIADVGLGSGPLEPLALAPRPPEPTLGGWLWGFERRGPRRWRLLTRRGDDVLAVHEFETTPASAADFAVGNRHAATHPASPFPGRLVAMRRTRAEHRRLDGRTLTVTLPDGRERQEQLTTEAALTMLREGFAVRPSPGEDAALRRLLEARP
jgi:N-hydroxyarylamine O-acetyltransferase